MVAGTLSVQPVSGDRDTPNGLTINSFPCTITQCAYSLMVKQWTHNPLSLGSIPSGRTKLSGYSIMDNTKSFYLLNVGSIPASRTMPC